MTSQSQLIAEIEDTIDRLPDDASPAEYAEAIVGKDVHVGPVRRVRGAYKHASRGIGMMDPWAALARTKSAVKNLFNGVDADSIAVRIGDETKLVLDINSRRLVRYKKVVRPLGDD